MESSNDIADGIQIPNPVRKQQILDAINDTNGDAIALSADPVEAELTRLHKYGFYTEPTSAIAPAALREYRSRDILDEDADIVIPFTGSGMKIEL